MGQDTSSAAALEVTLLLRAWGGGDAAALDRLTPLVYNELHRQAKLLMARESPDNILQPSALVNEAYLRLTADAPVEWENRRQFFAVSAGLMRRILIDFARARGAAKRGAGARDINLESLPGIATADDGVGLEQLIDIDEALTRLADLDERQARVVELRFFGGLEISEVAQVLNISEPTVVRDWRIARAWLHHALRPRRDDC